MTVQIHRGRTWEIFAISRGAQSSLATLTHQLFTILIASETHADVSELNMNGDFDRNRDVFGKTWKIQTLFNNDKNSCLFQYIFLIYRND